MKDTAFAARFEQAGEAWDVAPQLAAIRQEPGLSQKELFLPNPCTVAEGRN